MFIKYLRCGYWEAANLVDQLIRFNVRKVQIIVCIIDVLPYLLFKIFLWLLFSILFKSLFEFIFSILFCIFEILIYSIVWILSRPYCSHVWCLLTRHLLHVEKFQGITDDFVFKSSQIDIININMWTTSSIWTESVISCESYA